MTPTPAAYCVEHECHYSECRDKQHGGSMSAKIPEWWQREYSMAAARKFARKGDGQ